MVQSPALNVGHAGGVTIRKLFTSDESHPKEGLNGSSARWRCRLVCGGGVTGFAERLEV
jgi:hypothetical protein